MCSRFLAKHSALRRAANDFNHEQLSFRPMHATNICRRAVQKKAPCTVAMYKIRLATSLWPFTVFGFQVLCDRLSVDLQCLTRYSPPPRSSFSQDCVSLNPASKDRLFPRRLKALPSKSKAASLWWTWLSQTNKDNPFPASAKMTFTSLKPAARRLSLLSRNTK